MSGNIVIIGNSVVDISLPINEFPIQPDQHQIVQDRLITPGGQATTLLCGARLGLPMQILGNVGNDEMGEFWLSRVKAEGVDVEKVILRDDRPTSVSIVLTDPVGEHVFIGASAGSESGPTDFPAGWIKSIEQAKTVFVDGWGYRTMGAEVNQIANEIAKAAQVPIFFDPGPEIPYIPQDWLAAMLADSTVALLTYEEAQKITEETLEPLTMAKRIQQMGPELVLLKLGADGIVVHTQNETIHHSGFKVPVRDLTGAGDSVAAAAALAYLAGYSLERMASLANATGAACVQKLGAGINAPYKAEIEAVLHQVGRIGW